MVQRQTQDDNSNILSKAEMQGAMATSEEQSNLLQEILKGPEANAWLAITKLETLGNADPVIIAVLAKAAQAAQSADDSWICDTALSALRKLQPDSGQVCTLLCSYSPDHWIREGAVQGFAEIPIGLAKDRLQAILKTEQNTWVKVAALQTLLEIDRPLALDWANRLKESEDRDLKLIAVGVLSSAPTEHPMAVADTKLSPDDIERAAALFAAAAFETSSELRTGAFRKALESDLDPIVKVTLLGTLIARPDSELRTSAISALQKIDPEAGKVMAEFIG